MHKESSSSGHDNKKGDGIGEDGSYINFQAFVPVVTHAHTSLGDGALHVELHIRADGGANGSYQSQDIGATQLDPWNHPSSKHLPPTAFRQKPRQYLRQ